MDELKRLRDNIGSDPTITDYRKEIDAALAEAFRLGAQAEREACLKFLDNEGWADAKFYLQHQDIAEAK